MQRVPTYLSFYVRHGWQHQPNPHLTLMTPVIGKTDCVVSYNTRWASIALVCVGIGSLCNNIPAQANPSSPLADSRHTTTNDEILLLSTRTVGTKCSGETMEQRLHCEYLHINPSGKYQWTSTDWHNTLATETNQRPTFIYVHGNRVARGEDRALGLMVYRSLKKHKPFEPPIRFVIWSWPSSTIPGRIKDYQVKANRTRPVSWQLAWYLDKLPAQSAVSILGYSYGARITSGAMHILGGGNLGGLKIEPRHQHPTFRIALLAAAFNADWIQPGHYHGRAVSQVERLVLVTNQLDPAMRFFHLSNGRGRVHALGKAGVPNPRSLGPLAKRIRPINMTNSVGRSHSLTDYLAATSQIRAIWRNLLPDSASPIKPPLASASLVPPVE